MLLLTEENAVADWGVCSRTQGVWGGSGEAVCRPARPTPVCGSPEPAAGGWPLHSAIPVQPPHQLAGQKCLGWVSALFFLWGLGYFCLSSTLAFPSRAFTQVTHPHTLFIRLHLGGFTISLNCPGLLPWLGRAQELRESRGGCPGRGSLIVFNTVSADVKQHWTWAPDWACSTATLSSACRLASLVVGVFKVFAVPQEPPPHTYLPAPPL